MASDTDAGRNNLHSAILEEIPELALQPFHAPAKGTRSHVLLFEDAVFKGPRDKDQAPYIEQEIKILQHLDGKGLPVPKVTYVGKNAAFFEMTRLPGTPLTRDAFENMSAQERDFLAESLVGFMAGLAAACAQELIQFTGEYALKEESLESALVHPAVLAVLHDNFRSIESAVMEYKQMLPSKTPVVIHDDLHMGNIIMSPADDRMSGVIDFGYMNISLPEEGLFSWGRAFPDFTKDLCLRYSRLSGKDVSYRHYLLCNLVSKIKSIAHSSRTGNSKDTADAKTRMNEILTLLG